MKRLIIVAAILFFGRIASGQTVTGKSKGVSGAAAGATTSTNSPASASSGAANTGGQQTGYVYRLHRLYHIRYGTRKSTMKKIARSEKVPDNETGPLLRPMPA